MTAATTDQLQTLLSKIYFSDNDRNMMISNNISISRIIELVTKPLLERIDNLEKILGNATIAEVGDVVLTKDNNIFFGRFDTNGCKLIISYSSTNSFEKIETETYITKTSGYTPIGLVVIPSSHNVYNKSGLPGIIGLQYATLSGPNQYEKIMWGKEDGLKNPLYNFKYLNSIDISTGKINDKTITSINILGGDTGYGYLPSDNISGISSLDNFSNYMNNITDSNYYLPSPYLKDLSRNYVYSTDGYIENALSDFNGYQNTKQILGNYSDGSDNIISDYSENLTNNENNYPAFAACRKYGYNISGTAPDQWYLPGLGELGYVFVKQNEINSYLNKINSTFGTTVQTLYIDSDWYITSTNYFDKIYAIVFKTGKILKTSKVYDEIVRPFLYLG
jgi:hypothetical protein